MKIAKLFRSKAFFAITTIFAVISACVSPPDYPLTPEISDVRVSKDTMQRGSFTDTTFVSFNFTDGDGDIGSEDSVQLFVADSRDGFERNFKIPFVPELGASNGIKGEITARLFTTCCIFPDSLFLDGCKDTYAAMPYDPVVFQIYLIDNAGNKSNVLETKPVYIRCFE